MLGLSRWAGDGGRYRTIQRFYDTAIPWAQVFWFFSKVTCWTKLKLTRWLELCILHEHQPELRQNYGVKSLALFGSVARNEAHPDSDVDLLVEFDRPVGLFGLFALQDYLETLLGCPVDLGTQRSLKPRLREQVMRELVYIT